MSINLKMMRRPAALLALSLLLASCGGGSNSGSPLNADTGSSTLQSTKQQATLALEAVDPNAGFVNLFNGQNLDGWYTYTPSQGKNNDTEGVFKPVNGELKILDVPVTAENRDFGYIATNAEYSNYVLRFEYQWGTKKFPPRANDKRDSGLLYHMTGADKVWPTSVESQVQEGDTGDYFLLGGPRFDTETSSDGSTYQAGGTLRQDVGGRVIKSSTQDTLTGWNTVEVIVRGASSTHIVNGVVVNRSFNQTLNGQPLTSGHIAFQAEGAEITYRNIQIKELPDEASVPRVLAFSKTAGFRHASIPAALDAIDELGAANGFTVDRSEDAADFTDANLANYNAIVFVSTTGDFLNDEQQAALQQYIRGGGGYAGIHAAADAEYDWAWYGQLTGAYFDRHPAIQQATIKVEDKNHPSTAHLGDTWVRTDEWYDFRTNPRGSVNVLMTVDESTYTGGGMGADHPIAWYHAFDGGRAWYTALGHTDTSYAEPDFRQHLLGGIQYAIGTTNTLPPLDRSGWTFTASSAQTAAPNVADGDITTRWSSGSKQVPGMYFQVDFGKRRTFSRIELALDESQPFDYPRSYEVYASNDPANFGAPIASGVGQTLTRIDVPTTKARYMRIVQTGTDASRWWSIYELNVFGIKPPLNRSGWTFKASSAQTAATNVADGDITTRWSSGSAQVPGMYFQVDFGKRRTFSRIELALDESQPFDYPRSYEVYASNDPANFGAPITSGFGQTLTRIDVPATRARYMRIVQTGTDASRWWSIYELNVFAP
jgi:uncharacterized protein